MMRTAKSANGTGISSEVANYESDADSVRVRPREAPSDRTAFGGNRPMMLMVSVQNLDEAQKAISPAVPTSWM